MKVKLCPGSSSTLNWEGLGEAEISWEDAQAGALPKNVKRRRLKCDLCGRKVKSAIKVCHDGCCVRHYIPPHKPKRWWKKTHKSKRGKRRGAK